MLAALAVSAVSCKSDDDDEPAGGSTWVLVQIGDTKYEYDKSGRIIKEIESDGDAYTVTYGDGTITYASEDPSDNIKEVYKTNENGLITSGYFACEYDANGCLVKTYRSKSNDSSTTETLSWSEGKLTDYEKNYGGSQTFKQFEYDTDSPMHPDCIRFINQMYLPIGHRNIITQGGGYGKVPSVPVKIIYDSDYTHNWRSETRTFSDFDDNGCPATMTVQNSYSSKTINLVWAKR